MDWTDHQNLDRLRRRDADAWHVLVDDLIPTSFALIGHLVRGDRTLAEDLHQEVWRAAMDAIESFDPRKGSVRSWILGIARNTVALHYRRQQTKPAPLTDDAALPDQEALLPEDVAGEVELAHAVRGSLLCLPPDQQRVVQEKYLEGRSVEEIAQRMHKTKRAIEGLLARGRAQLRNLLQPFEVAPKRASHDV